MPDAIADAGGRIGRLSLILVLLALLLSIESGSSSAGELVQVENASRATACAEEDNVYVKFSAPGIRRFVIDAALPAYFSRLAHDSTAPNFAHCDMSHDPSYAFEPKQLVLYEDDRYRLVGHTFAHFWRKQSVDFRVGKATVHDLHLVQLIRKLGGRSIEILVVYPADGYWRAKPLPPRHGTDTAYGSSFLIGPVEAAGRPFVAFSAIEFVPAELTFRLMFPHGEGRLTIIEAAPGRTRLAVTLPAEAEVATFAALRSMFVSPRTADTAEIRLQTDAATTAPIPILKFTHAAARAVSFTRSVPSAHNASAPDLSFGDFSR